MFNKELVIRKYILDCIDLQDNPIFEPTINKLKAVYLLFKTSVFSSKNNEKEVFITWVLGSQNLFKLDLHPLIIKDLINELQLDIKINENTVLNFHDFIINELYDLIKQQQNGRNR